MVFVCVRFVRQDCEKSMRIFIVITLLLLSALAHGVVVCETKDGRTCCWDTEKDGVFRPLSCM